MNQISLWRWEFTDDQGKRRRSSWRMTETEAAKYRDAVKVEGTLEVRQDLGGTSDWQRKPAGG
jgi:hypothetical protein